MGWSCDTYIMRPSLKISRCIAGGKKFAGLIRTIMSLNGYNAMEIFTFFC